MSNCVQCHEPCELWAVYCNACLKKNTRALLLMAVSIAVLVGTVAGLWIAHAYVGGDARSFTLNPKQAELVLDCWSNGWEATFQSDGEGGVEVTCKAAY